MVSALDGLGAGRAGVGADRPARHNFRRLRGWPNARRAMSPAKKTLDVAISFIIPTVILLIIFSQMRAFFGDRFNLGTNLITCATRCPMFSY